MSSADRSVNIKVYKFGPPLTIKSNSEILITDGKVSLKHPGALLLKAIDAEQLIRFELVEEKPEIKPEPKPEPKPLTGKKHKKH